MKRILFLILALVLLTCSLFPVNSVYAANCGTDINVGEFDCDKIFRDVKVPENKADNKAIQNILGQVFFWVGVLAVIGIMVSGIMYVISAGDSSKMGRAKNGVIYSALGLIIALLASVIVNFVLEKVFG